MSIPFHAGHPDEPAAVTAASASSRPVPASSNTRDAFTGDELAVVLSHYDLGAIESIIEFPRGSRRAPKAIVTSEQGRFLLKRRAKGRDDPYKVAFCHAIQLHLAQQKFPLPHLIGTRRDNNSMLQVRGNVYELFEYIPGQGYPLTLEATADSGRVLSLFHKLLAAYKPPWDAPTGSYHASPSVQQGLKMIPGAISGGDDVARDLTRRYEEASTLTEEKGLPTWPTQIVHADWHPGNMLFRENHVVAVIDYDSSRMLPRVIDAANGALQFSILGGDEPVSDWPEHLDENRFRRFFRGYDAVQMLSEAELAVVPFLMIEALIAEAVLPIAATGQFGKLEGLTFLRMVQRKAKWLASNAQRLVGLASG